MLLYFVIVLAGIIVVVFPIYFIWYTIRGRHVKEKRRRQKAAADSAAAKPRKKGRWGVPEGSYCYPAINDVMGFEFVKVVASPDFSKPAAPAGETETSWANSTGIGTSTVSQSNVSNVSAVADDDTGNHENDQDSEADNTSETQSGTNETQNQDPNLDESIEDSAANFDLINKLGNWNELPQQFDDDFPSEEESKAIGDANPECIDNKYTEEQAQRIQEENETATRARLLRERQYQIDDEKHNYVSGKDLNELKSDAAEIEEQTKQNNTNGEGQNTRPDESDLPDTD